MRIFPVSFSRASNGALSLVLQKLAEKGMLTYSVEEADYLMAVGDRWETFDFTYQQWQAGKHIIHLWAGEKTPGFPDEVHRTALTLMSDMQLCTNPEAKLQTERICKNAGKEPNAIVVGNVMMENLEIDESVLKEAGLEPGGYDLVLYNPFLGHIKEDIAQIMQELIEGHINNSRPLHGTQGFPYIWIRPNVDRGLEYIKGYATSPSQKRPRFLGLMKNCRKFITNSSCMYYEAPFLLKKKQIINIGLRNKNRNSKHAQMDIPNASENIVAAFQKLEETENQRKSTF